jgi:flavin-binding protein dodecin
MPWNYNSTVVPSPPDHHLQEPVMSEHTYKMIELVGSSHTSIESAVQNAVATAGINERTMRWFEVVETRGHIENGTIAHWQVRVKIGVTLVD